MNSRLAHLLVRLYPPLWRERYGAEFETFLQSGRGGVRTSINVAWSALCERIIATPGLTPNGDAHSGQFSSWCIRAPWAIFSLCPLLLLGAAYFAALFMLWSGWKFFLPEADTPFHGPMYGLENLYFQADKFFYFGSPVFIGWAIGLLAARQRIKAVWPCVGMVLITLVSATNQVHASRTAVPRGLGHISMSFAVDTSIQGILDRLLYTAVTLSVTMLPYLLWRLHRLVPRQLVH